VIAIRISRHKDGFAGSPFSYYDISRPRPADELTRDSIGLSGGCTIAEKNQGFVFSEEYPVDIAPFL
jgi:hypothetical protein